MPRQEEALGGEMENTKRDAGRSCHVGVVAKSVGDTSEYVCSSVVGLCRQDELKLLKRGVGGSVRGGWTLLLPLPPPLLLVPAISATGSANVAWRFSVEYGRWLSVRQPRFGSWLLARRGGGVGTGTNGTSNGVSSRSGIDCRVGGALLPPALLPPAGSRLAGAPIAAAAAARAGCETRWSVYRVHSVTALARVQTRRLAAGTPSGEF